MELALHMPQFSREWLTLALLTPDYACTKVLTLTCIGVEALPACQCSLLSAWCTHGSVDVTGAPYKFIYNV